MSNEMRDWMADEIHDLRVDKARLEDEVRGLRDALKAARAERFTGIEHVEAFAKTPHTGGA